MIASMAVHFLVRHAEPVSPRLHEGADADRRLSPRGRRQAQWIARHLSGAGAVLSSPYARCLETAQIIALSLGLAAKVAPELHIAGAFTPGMGGPSCVYVAHSNNIPVALARLGVECHACAHASCWTVHVDAAGRTTQSRYVAPPAL